MSSRTFCDRCGCCIDTQHGNSEMELRICNHTAQGAVYHLDFCDRCTQSLKMWMSNLPNREVKYREAHLPFLKDGSFANVVLRLHDGARPSSFRRRSWPAGETLAFNVTADEVRMVRYVSGECAYNDLTAEDFRAHDWCEWICIENNGEDDDEEEDGC